MKNRNFANAESHRFFILFVYSNPTDEIEGEDFPSP